MNDKTKIINAENALENNNDFEFGDKFIGVDCIRPFYLKHYFGGINPNKEHYSHLDFETIINLWRNDTVLQDPESSYIGNVHNLENYVLKSCFGVSERIPSINYIEPLIIKDNGLNELGAADFETACYPTNVRPSDDFMVLENIELNQVKANNEKFLKKTKKDKDSSAAYNDYGYDVLKWSQEHGDPEDTENTEEITEKKTSVKKDDPIDIYAQLEKLSTQKEKDESDDDLATIVPESPILQERLKKKRFISTNFNESVGQFVVSASLCFNSKTYFFSIDPNVLKQTDPDVIKAGSEMVLLKFWRQLVKSVSNYRYQNKVEYHRRVVFYFHNFGGFDGYFLNNFLLTNKECIKEFSTLQTVKTFIANGNILSLIYNNDIVIYDSLKMINMSLKNLAKDVLNDKKLDFNVNDNSYNKICEIFKSPKLFSELKNYNIKDSTLLLKAMQKMQLISYQKLKMDISNYATCPSLTMSLFRSRFYNFPSIIYPILKYNKNSKIKFCLKKNSIKSFQFERSKKYVNLKTQKNAIFITKPFYEKAFRDAFYGGRCELIKPRVFSDLLWVDFNSMYPFCMKSPLPFGSPIKIPSNFLWTKKNFNEFYGFIKVRFISPIDKDFFPFLPRKHPDGYNVYALGVGEGWFYSKEIQYAVKLGYKVDILDGLSFIPKAGFREFVLFVYKMREEGKHTGDIALVNFAKMLLNSNFGRFGMSILNSITNVVNIENDQQISNIITGNIIKSITYLNNNTGLIESTLKTNNKMLKRKFFDEKRKSYLPDNIKKLAVEQDSLFNSSQYSLIKYKNANQAIHISAAITSQSRLLMYPFLSKLYKADLLAYTDTDSIFVKSGSKVSQMPIIKKRLDNFKLGYLKVEKQGHEYAGVFVDKKVWAVHKKNTKELIIKARGVFKSSLLDSENQQILKKAMDDVFLKKSKGIFTYKNKTTSRIVKNKKNFTISSPIQGQRPIISNQQFDKYRVKIFNRNKVWVGTKSLILDQNFQNITFENLIILNQNFVSNI
jgi:hypothetical protein